MDSRREFLKKAALMAGGMGAAGGFPAVLQRALAIDPAPGSTWLDAEHVVILMQENRSFDHCYGALRGVRGFRDPRAVTLPSGNPVWLQSSRAGETYAPFRLDIHDTKATWMSSLPHSWADQTDAHHGGRQDGWLDAKRSGNRDYARMPLTMGCYDRRDLPFYYALADAFTVCDQNFCSSLTGTTPNRLHLWTGTLRARPSTDSKANVRNEDVDYGSEASWTTFPERLESAGIPWKIYQNEISLDSGLKGEADAWLANFTDNPIEWFTQYHVRFAASHRRHLAERVQRLPAEIEALEALTPSTSRDRKLSATRAELEAAQSELKQFTDAAFAALSPAERNLHERAFTTNSGDPDYRKLTTLKYQDGGRPREMQVPAGDVLHQFRSDVQSGKLPTVSWIVAPENFSDHPGAPWYGAWYLSECLDILTKNPEVWRKTIFVLCYDENDGYFDHIPPFVPPDPERPETGRVSAGLDPSPEWVRKWQEQEFAQRHPGAQTRTGPIGLGFRVPLVIASPWSRGGYVNSQVFDHTSILRMLEVLLSHRTGRPIRETNISAWRRAVCGDLSTVFRPFDGSRVEKPKPVDRDPFLESIHQAQFRPLPSGYHRFSAGEIAEARSHPESAPWRSLQEEGTRPSSALPYELSVDGALDAAGSALVIRFGAGRDLFGDRAAGAPFHVYSPVPVRPSGNTGTFAPGRTWSYTVLAGDALTDAWRLQDFEGGRYHLRVHGPNGFFRELRGTARDPRLEISLRGTREGTGVLSFRNTGAAALDITVRDLSYGRPPSTVTVPAGGTEPGSVIVDLSPSHGWYDFQFQVAGSPDYTRRYAGRIETGRDSVSDPAMGRARA
ncbi:MAG: phospholipase C, phosphocholine-specific [Verrucomicrobiales bacterium]|nr:phospholipase C, phosphocholine-specific [Verrucomicrobiales bacterium]